MKIGRLPFRTHLSKFMNFKLSFTTEKVLLSFFNNFPQEDDFRDKSYKTHNQYYF